MIDKVMQGHWRWQYMSNKLWSLSFAGRQKKKEKFTNLSRMLQYQTEWALEFIYGKNYNHSKNKYKFMDVNF